MTIRGRRIYDDYLASAVWKAKRAPVLARAFGHCERCERQSASLDVHHRTYARFGGKELMADLEALCRAVP
ncbi:MAG: hypothetical protein WDN28_12870 [Chthoniobacter sp.]